MYICSYTAMAASRFRLMGRTNVSTEVLHPAVRIRLVALEFSLPCSLTVDGAMIISASFSARSDFNVISSASPGPNDTNFTGYFIL